MKRLLLYHFPPILYASAILFVSTVPDLKTPEVRFLAFDKVAHFLEYGLFALLLARSIGNILNPGNNRKYSAYLYSLAVIVIFAAMDEMLQRSVQGRFADGFDYLSDIAGGSLVLLLLWIKDIIFLKERSSKSNL